MNKRAFIRILEAMVAILIVFGYVVSILPKLPKPTGEIPAELDNTLNAVLKEVQNNPKFRKEVIVTRDIALLEGNIKKSLPPFSPWKFAFKVCTSTTSDCGYFVQDAFVQPGDESEFSLLLKDKLNVYTKSVFLSKLDATAPGSLNPVVDSSVQCSRVNPAQTRLSNPPPVNLPPPDPCAPTMIYCCPLMGASACCENQVLTLYMWSEV